MGNEDGDALPGERPIHQVTLSRSFAISVTEVTQGQYLRVMGHWPSYHHGDDNLPVEQVRWFDTVLYANTLSKLEGLRACYTITETRVEWNPDETCGYRLPTEAEWEYAAKAAQRMKYAGGDKLDEVAWHGSATQSVGMKKPNAWGLFDMSGNVGEWVWDWYGDYGKGPLENPHGPDRGSYRVYRGGSFLSVSRDLRIATRLWLSPDARQVDLGFRVVRSFR